jgi:ATP-binding cassette subfamily B protein
VPIPRHPPRSADLQVSWKSDVENGRVARRRQDDGPRATFLQLIPHLTSQRGPLALAIVLSILASAASLAQPLLVGVVIGDVQAGRSLGGTVWLIVGLVLVSAVLGAGQHYLLQRMGEGVVLSTRRQLVARLLRLPIAEFDTRRTGDLVSRVGADATLLRAVLTQGLVEAIGGALTFIGAIVAMILIDWVLLLLTVGVIAIAFGAVGALSTRIRQASAAAQERVGALAAAVERAVSGIRTIRAANATTREIEAIDSESVGAYQAGLGVARASAAVVPVAGIAMQASLLVVLGVGGFRVADGSIAVASLVSFVLFLFMLIIPLGQFFGAITAVNQALGALGRIQEIIDLPAEGDARATGPSLATDSRHAAPSSLGEQKRASSDPEDAHLRSSNESGGGVSGDRVDRGATSADPAAIAFRDVEFAYAASPEPVLRGVTFEVARGQRTALVGPSGAGKSTILALIERFYDPTSGSIALDGVDASTIDRTALRDRIGYVEQDAPVLAGTVRDNLLLGRAEATDAECEAVLRTVNLAGRFLEPPAGGRPSAAGDQDEAHRASPDASPGAPGLDANVGEDGIMLSGGERQRLAIARALLAAPPILLLDEATASLDGTNEALLREAIDAASAGRTLLVIAHRLATVVDSDRIVVLDRGRVVGIGTHEELLESTPLYRELARHQLLV